MLSRKSSPKKTEARKRHRYGGSNARTIIVTGSTSPLNRRDTKITSGGGAFIDERSSMKGGVSRVSSRLSKADVDSSQSDSSPLKT